MKHVTTSANDTYLSQFENNIELLEKTTNFKATSQSTTKRNKKNFHEQTFGMFTNMVKNYHGEEF